MTLISVKDSPRACQHRTQLSTSPQDQHVASILYGVGHQHCAAFLGWKARLPGLLKHEAGTVIQSPAMKLTFWPGTNHGTAICQVASPFTMETLYRDGATIPRPQNFQSHASLPTPGAAPPSLGVPRGDQKPRHPVYPWWGLVCTHRHPGPRKGLLQTSHSSGNGLSGALALS